MLMPEKVERHFKCRFYDDCLDKAAEQNWISFSCRNCPLFSDAGNSAGTREGEDDE